MTEPSPPPRVTVTDPSRPAPKGDLIAAEPWRPSRRLGWGAVAVVVLLLGASAVAGTASSRRQARQQATALLAGLDVAVATDRLSGSDTAIAVGLDLRLRNVGSSDLRLVGQRLDAPGWRSGSTVHALVAGAAAPVRFDHAWRCGADEQLPTVLLLDVEVAGGGQRTLSAPLDHDGANGLAQLRAGTCGDFDPARAVQVGRTSSVLVGRQVVVDVELLNRSTGSVQLSGPVVGGFVVTGAPAAPIRLPGRRVGSPAGTPPSTRLHLGLRVAGCSAQPNPRDRLPETLGLLLRVTGRGGSAMSLQYVTGLGELLHQLAQDQCGPR